MQDHPSSWHGRGAKGPRRRTHPNGRSRSGADGNRAPRGPNRRPSRAVNGNRLHSSNGKRGDAGTCIKCGHPAPDGKLCAFHRVLLNAFRKEVPDQDPRRFRF